MDLLPSTSGRVHGPPASRPAFGTRRYARDSSAAVGIAWLCSSASRAALRGKRNRSRLHPVAVAGVPLSAYQDKDYDAERNARYWSQRPVEVINRSIGIVTGFGAWFLDTRVRNGQDLTNIGGKQAERLRKLLTRLGPAFVKIGQAVSSRPDVTPPSYTYELEKLQDQIPPFNDAQAMQVILEELGRPASSVFSSMTPSPVAAASLGQVYRARLRDGGLDVAVKVQRPGIREAMALDIFILRWLVNQVRRIRQVNSDLAGLLDEWASSLFRELDYQREARNGGRFRELYGEMQGVYVPKMVAELTTERVLVMEWVQGNRLRSAGNLREGDGGPSSDLSMVDIGVQCSLEQMLEVGFYHSDPHPGNLMRTPDGRLAYIDFGMMGQINPDIRRGLITATLHLVNREFGELADDFVTLGLLPAGSDKDVIAPALTGVFSEAVAGGVSNISFGELSGNLGRTMYQYSFRIPPFYTLLVRSLTVLEGIALSSDPDYKVLAAAYPWIARRLITNTAPELRETLHALLYKDGRFQFSRLESLLRQATLAPSRPSDVRKRQQAQQQPGAPQPNQDMVIESGGQALQLLLSREGEFVFNILVDELAKGLDAGWRLVADAVVADARARALAAFGMGDGASGLPSSSGILSQNAAMQLLRPLLQAPALSTPNDRTQVEGIARLAATLQEVSAAQTPNPEHNASRSGTGSPGSRASSEPLDRASAILRWLAQEAGSLPPEQRAQALRMPLLLLAKLSERITARALRSALSPAGPLRPAANLVSRPSIGRGVGRFSGASGGVQIRSIPLSLGNGSSVQTPQRSPVPQPPAPSAPSSPAPRPQNGSMQGSQSAGDQRAQNGVPNGSERSSRRSRPAPVANMTVLTPP